MLAALVILNISFILSLAPLVGFVRVLLAIAVKVVLIFMAAALGSQVDIAIGHFGIVDPPPLKAAAPTKRRWRMRMSVGMRLSLGPFTIIVCQLFLYPGLRAAYKAKADKSSELHKQGESDVLLIQDPAEPLRPKAKAEHPETHDTKYGINELYEPYWHVSYHVGCSEDRQAPLMRMGPISHEEVDAVVER
ncbi:hypothetical protein FPHYL_9616 [Fusarium phyllophilum]|uniref:Uncharacterized protein n=1 Tax=Fusarium phyllophilum TaxID=47803 RepID=A0A8H5N0Z4_9HYPO|nr:hypothetical protein FPHYL_9616 [Fusarium phyllophilum]